MGLLVGVVCLCLVATLAVAIPPPIAAPNSVQISPEQMEAGSKETAGEIGAADKKAPPPPPEIQPVVASMEVHPDVAPEVSLGASKDSLPIPKLTDDRKDVVDGSFALLLTPIAIHLSDRLQADPTTAGTVSILRHDCCSSHRSPLSEGWQSRTRKVSSQIVV